MLVLVKEMILFGSYVRGDANESSDVDILVELDKKNKFRNFFALMRFLEEKLGKKIDLGTKKGLKPSIREKIKGNSVYV